MEVVEISTKIRRTTTKKRGLSLLERPNLDIKTCALELKATLSAEQMLANA